MQLSDAGNYHAIVSNPVGVATSAIAVLTVVPPPRLLPILRSGTNLTLRWSGGYPPYELQTTSNLTPSAWLLVSNAPSDATNWPVPISTPAGFSRVRCGK